MSAKHTPEPWTLLGRVNKCSIGNHSVIRDQGGTPIGYIAYSDDASRAIACVNACAGIADPAEAIREAREMLERCYQVHNTITIYTPQSHQDKEANREHCDNIKEVLAKLQPKGVA